jgi:hypothetical protein
MCSTIVDDKKRLKCFDEFFPSNAPSENATGNAGAKSSWSIIESTSPVMAARSLAVDW